MMKFRQVRKREMVAQMNQTLVHTRCFVDVDGHIWSTNASGESNFPGEIEIIGDTVRVLGTGDGSGARLVEDEYQLWPSLTSLAMALELDLPPSVDGSISLDQAIAEAHKQVESFRGYWLRENERNPDHFPLTLPRENAGLWFEQISAHEAE